MDPQSSFFQYSRYFAINKELAAFNFSSFLDVGCAEGMHLKAVKVNVSNCETCGLDFSRNALMKTKFYSKRFSPYLICADATCLPFLNCSFDAVLCSETLEHIVDDTNAINELSRITAKVCIITVPSFNNNWAMKKFKPDLNCKHDSHLRKYSKSELKFRLKKKFKKVSVFNLSSWYLASADIVIHNLLPDYLSARFSHFLALFADIDYKLCKTGAHGHSFICICEI
jgi:ubiquinone/menaquinone biosynthesis C-methylase UbiE